MDRWRTWNAQKLPGRAVNRFVRGWVGTRGSSLKAIEVHRTACIVTHPPGGEHANEALVNPANERLHGTRFTPDECWLNLHGDPTTGRWDKELATFPFQAIDGLVSEFGGDELRTTLESLPADANGVRCAVGSAVCTPTTFELRELYSSLVHAVPPQYNKYDAEPEWEASLRSTYHAAFETAHSHGLGSIAVPILGSGAKGGPKEATMRIAAEAAVSWQSEGASAMTVRFGVQDSSLAHALVDALDSAIGKSGANFALAAPPPAEGERWALPRAREAHA